MKQPINSSRNKPKNRIGKPFFKHFRNASLTENANDKMHKEQQQLSEIYRTDEWLYVKKYVKKYVEFLLKLLFKKH